MRRARHGAAVAFALWAGALAPVGPAAAGPIEDLQPGRWYEVPNSRLRPVVPNPVPPGITGPSSVMLAWSGAAYDTRRDRLIVWGGGHNDYGGNELYAFDLNTLTWSRIWGPSSSIPATYGTCNETYPDGMPSSRHTYDGLEYLPVADRFFAWGGSLWCNLGRGSYWAWTFDFATGTWRHVADPPISYHDLEQATATDMRTGRLYLADPSDGLVEYDPATDQWTEVKSGTIDYGVTAAMDYDRKKFVAVGSGQTTLFDLAPGGAAGSRTLATTGARDMELARYPGVAYDPTTGLIVAWHGGPDVFTLNLDTLVWTRRTPASGNTVTPTGPSPNGTYGRWQYIPSKNVFIGVNSVDQNVYIYRLSPGGGAPPDSVAPSQTQDLLVR